MPGLASVEYSKKDSAFLFHIDVDSKVCNTGQNSWTQCSSHVRLVQMTEVTAVKAYAEVWGTAESGYQFAPVAWMQAMVDPYKTASGDFVITLQLHKDWIHNVRVLSR